jgi:predicted AlkP superfamily phosphohydrolase/phosphomutase
VPEFLRALEQDLLDLVDGESGQPAVSRVLRTDDLYGGEHRAHLPDLLVEWSQRRALGSATVGTGRGGSVRLSSSRIGTVEGINRSCRSGDHRRDGLFVAVAPGLGSERLAFPVSIMDFAPTLTRLLGVELVGVAGRPISRLLDRT